ncbi:MAG: hypothetical protein RLZZ217_791 [Planctomycetota bacterium]
MARGKLCPVCLTENTGGLPHRWHKEAHRKKAYGVEQVAEMARQTVEANRVRLVLADEKRTAYHREYWAKNIERRREQSRLAKERMRMKRRLKPLIEHLCHAVDLGRESARW